MSERQNPYFYKSLISLNDLSVSGIEFILKKAEEVRTADFNETPIMLPETKHKKVLVRAFAEDSTRTRSSHAMAGKEIGMTIEGFTNDAGTSTSKGESLYSTLGTYRDLHAAAIIMRHKLEGAQRFLSEELCGLERNKMFIINAGDGAHEHPTQGLLDALTIRQIQKNSGKAMEDMRAVFVGDNRYSRTVNSIAGLLGRMGMHEMMFINPEALGPSESLIKQLENSNVQVTIENHLADQLRKTDLCYCTRIQEERLPDKRILEKSRDAFTIRTQHLKGTPDHFRLMHPLPMNKDNRGIAQDVDKHPKAIYLSNKDNQKEASQVENGLYVRKAYMLLALWEGFGQDYGEQYDEPAFIERTLKLDDSFMSAVEIGDYTPKEGILGRIQTGYVFDHLPAYMSRFVLDVLHPSKNCFTLTASGLPSSRRDRKDIVKIGNYSISLEQMAKIGVIVPGTTVTRIEQDRPVTKYILGVPNYVEGFLTCENPNCITRPEHHEGATTKMIIENGTVKCHYCDAITPVEELAGKHLKKYG